MKKISLLFSSFCVSLSVFSQTNNDIVPSEPIRQSKFSLGIKGGVGHSFIAPYKNYAFNTSSNLGLSAVVSPWANWGIGLDAVFSSEGATYKSSDVEFAQQLDYIRIPLKAIYFFRNYEHDFRPKVTLGPSLGILINEKNSFDASMLDLGANASIGFNYRLIRAVWLNADVNYYQGFTDVYTNNSVKDLNGNIRLDLGVSFGF
jgi:hypothetical protein